MLPGRSLPTGMIADILIVRITGGWSGMSADTLTLFRPGYREISRRAVATIGTYAVYLAALAIFGASRAVVIAGVKFGALLVRDPDPRKWDAGPEWYHRLLRFDSGFYADIAKHGYHYNADPSVMSSTAFYPLYPLAARAITSATGIGEGVALLLVANVAAAIAVLLMTKLIKDETDAETALWSVALLMFFPTAFFFSAGYTESLCLVFVLLSLLALRDEKFLLASLAAGLAVGTRSIGIALAPIILLEIVRHRASPWPQTILKMAICGLLATSGLIAFIGYLGVTIGHPLAFVQSQSAWHGGTLVERFLDAVSLTQLRHGGWFLIFMPLAIYSVWRLRLDLSLYALGVLLVPYLTLGITHSMNRYVLMCFPVFVILALLCKSRPIIGTIIIAISSAYLLEQTARFSQWYWVG